jgi:hypothetical protein
MKQDHSDFFIDRVRSKSPTTAGSPLNPQILKFGDGSEIVNMGLTKREYFAAMALQGLLAHGNPKTLFNHASMSVYWADELIKHLNK